MVCWRPLACWIALAGLAWGQNVEVPAGTHVLLQLENSVSTRNAQPGDFVYFRTAVPVVVSNRIVIPAGSYVRGLVRDVQRPGRLRGRAELAIELVELTLPGGRQCRLTASLASVEDAGARRKIERERSAVQQGADTGRDAGRIVVLAGSGAWLGAVADRSARGAGLGAAAGGAVGLATVLLTSGRHVELRRGTTIDIIFERPVRLD